MQTVAGVTSDEPGGRQDVTDLCRSRPEGLAAPAASVRAGLQVRLVHRHLSVYTNTALKQSTVQLFIITPAGIVLPEASSEYREHYIH